MSAVKESITVRNLRLYDEAKRNSAANMDNLRSAIDADRARLADALGLRRDGNRFFCHCQADGANHSTGDLSVEAGFKCHKCGWSGDGFSLVRTVKGGDFPSAVEFVRGVYGVAADLPARKSKSPAKKPAKIHADADAAAKAAGWSVGQRTGEEWKEARRDLYNDATGQSVAAVVRFDRADGSTDENGKPLKTYVPIHRVEGGWKVGDPPGKWPLFNLPAIQASEGTVFICEGEKAASSGIGIGLTCTATAHGAKAPGKTDLEPLRGRDVVLLPDNDKAGRDYAVDLAQRLNAAGAASVKIVNLPGLPKKGDIAEYVALHPGTAPDTLRGKVEALAASAPLWVLPVKQELVVEPGTGLAPIEAAMAGRPFACTDLGNAERLVAYHGDEFRWDISRKCWRVWDGRRWAADSALPIHALAADTARQIRMEAAKATRGDGTRDAGRDLFEWAIKSESRDRLAAMIEVAKARPGIAVAPDRLDADPWALNVLNGTIDLRTGTLRPHRREDLLTKLSPVPYVPGKRCARWERFLEVSTKGDTDVIGFLQKASGYTLTGDISEEKLFLIYGPEASGKTTYLESQRACLGEYARTIQADLLARQRESRGGGSASPELAGLAGARLASGSEMEQGRELAEALAKNLTGGEPITARHLYAEMFDFLPQFKLWLALNHCPKVSADDGAVWRRIVRIGFEHTVPAAERDKTLKPYLRDPAGGAPAVLAWAVEGCLRWQREGLDIPEAVLASTAAYRTESDPLATFFEDCLRFNSVAWSTWTSIQSAYSRHAAEMGVGEKYRVSPKRLQDRLKAKDCSPEKRMDGRGWLGVEVETDWQDGSQDTYGGYGGFSKTYS